jgi:hypothetical protein
MRRLHRIVQAQREEDPLSATVPKPEARPLRASNLVLCWVADLNVWRKAFGGEWFGSAFGSELGVVGEEIERATTRRDMRGTALDGRMGSLGASRPAWHTRS